MWGNWMAIVLNLHPAFKNTNISMVCHDPCRHNCSRRYGRRGIERYSFNERVQKILHPNIAFLSIRSNKSQDLRQHWCSLVLDLFSSKLYHLNGKIVLLGDGLKIQRR